MSSTFHPRLDSPSSHTSTPTTCTTDQLGTREQLGRTNPPIWPDTRFGMSGSNFGLDWWKKGLQLSQNAGFAYEKMGGDGVYAEALDRFSEMEGGGRSREPSVASSGVYAYSRATMQHQFGSACCSGMYGDERAVPASDPASDLSSDCSDRLQTSGLPIGTMYPHEMHELTPPSSGYSEAFQAPLPEFVVDELKRLKLENMALRRMANEVVRMNVGARLLDGSTMGGCDRHVGLTASSRVARVLEGADAVQVYSEGGGVGDEQGSFGRRRERGTSASMWAPSRQGVGRASPREADISTGMGGSRRLHASDVSAGELSRRVATADANPATVKPCDPASDAWLQTRVGTKSGWTDAARDAWQKAGCKLENARASTLVSMILERRGQEASVLLQHQLKTSSAERQREILEAIRAKMLALSHDRHGNFLVQAAIGTRPEMAMHLKGGFVDLTMSQFGCHVVQRALAGDEAMREAVTHELLGSRLDETLTSRHSIHVWQRVLETEWTRSEFREHVFVCINRQLEGRWARTARQETGSIICQNIFESAQSGEKAPCLHEVLEELDECATNQWGVWVVQHIIEHGDDDERRAALERVVRSASKLTLSQYGQKAVMSGLKTGDAQFLHAYVESMCRSEQPRRPALIDVCLAPHGMQIVTQLLTTVDAKTRERLMSTVRRNSVFLKGSKTGMKVHQLCERARAFSGY